MASLTRNQSAVLKSAQTSRRVLSSILALLRGHYPTAKRDRSLRNPHRNRRLQTTCPPLALRSCRPAGVTRQDGASSSLPEILCSDYAPPPACRADRSRSVQMLPPLPNRLSLRRPRRDSADFSRLGSWLRLAGDGIRDRKESRLCRRSHLPLTQKVHET